MPGDRPLTQGEYYAHPGNKFWRIIAKITGEALPTTYEEKKELLARHNIGLWDVAETANRKGSLDTAIKDATPNDLDSFLDKFKTVKVVGLNGSKAQRLFDAYFQTRRNIRYLNLPSTSPANSRISFDVICRHWRQIFE